MISTKSVYDPVEESDGDRILVSRYRPRGLSKERLSLADHLKDLAPSVELLRDWKRQEISWDEYQSRYHDGMQKQCQVITELARKAESRTITLLCFEKEEDPCCHRHLLKKLIDKEGQHFCRYACGAWAHR